MICDVPRRSGEGGVREGEGGGGKRKLRKGKKRETERDGKEMSGC